MKCGLRRFAFQLQGAVAAAILGTVLMGFGMEPWPAFTLMTCFYIGWLNRS